ncbi:NAD-dependent epimerase/dehydratase family protein [Myxococcota bacterium]|nr:NAD-dependent epimerase/dehydratase family protein [Myxococcota bacterium]
MKTTTSIDTNEPDAGPAPRRLRAPKSDRPIVITGGAGFIGSNLAARLCASGREVIVFDSLVRPGVEVNAAWLHAEWPSLVHVEVADVRDRAALRRVLREAGAVFHFAAQVAVTTSLADPAADFEVNARGTLNVLEELRALEAPPPLVVTSTNKVYGDLAELELVERDKRWEPRDEALVRTGLGEGTRLDFRSPYGCSKGAADSYVLDYARTYGLPATVFRMSCIYGPRQLGTEDQGWVAHFLLRALDDAPITVFGDGKQVRDLLYVDDLVEAMLLAEAHIDDAAGHAFNIGGGPGNSVSLLELLELIEELRRTRPACVVERWRPGDQRYYVSDFSRFHGLTSWTPEVGHREGVTKLYQWLARSKSRSVLSRVDGKKVERQAS